MEGLSDVLIKGLAEGDVLNNKDGLDERGMLGFITVGGGLGNVGTEDAVFGCVMNTSFMVTLPLSTKLSELSIWF